MVTTGMLRLNRVGSCGGEEKTWLCNQKGETITRYRKQSSEMNLQLNNGLFHTQVSTTRQSNASMRAFLHSTCSLSEIILFTAAGVDIRLHDFRLTSSAATFMHALVWGYITAITLFSSKAVAHVFCSWFYLCMHEFQRIDVNTHVWGHIWQIKTEI